MDISEILEICKAGLSVPAWPSAGTGQGLRPESGSSRCQTQRVQGSAHTSRNSAAEQAQRESKWPHIPRSSAAREICSELARLWCLFPGSDSVPSPAGQGRHISMSGDCSETGGLESPVPQTFHGRTSEFTCRHVQHRLARADAYGFLCQHAIMGRVACQVATGTRSRPRRRRSR